MAGEDAWRALPYAWECSTDVDVSVQDRKCQGLGQAHVKMKKVRLVLACIGGAGTGSLPNVSLPSFDFLDMCPREFWCSSHLRLGS